MLTERVTPAGQTELFEFFDEPTSLSRQFCKYCRDNFNLTLLLSKGITIAGSWEHMLRSHKSNAERLRFFEDVAFRAILTSHNYSIPTNPVTSTLMTRIHNEENQVPDEHQTLFDQGLFLLECAAYFGSSCALQCLIDHKAILLHSDTTAWLTSLPEEKVQKRMEEIYQLMVFHAECFHQLTDSDCEFIVAPPHFNKHEEVWGYICENHVTDTYTHLQRLLSKMNTLLQPRQHFHQIKSLFENGPAQLNPYQLNQPSHTAQSLAQQRALQQITEGRENALRAICGLSYPMAAQELTRAQILSTSKREATQCRNKVQESIPEHPDKERWGFMWLKDFDELPKDEQQPILERYQQGQGKLAQAATTESHAQQELTEHEHFLQTANPLLIRLHLLFQAIVFDIRCFGASGPWEQIISDCLNEDGELLADLPELATHTFHCPAYQQLRRVHNQAIAHCNRIETEDTTAVSHTFWRIMQSNFFSPSGNPCSTSEDAVTLEAHSGSPLYVFLSTDLWTMFFILLKPISSRHNPTRQDMAARLMPLAHRLENDLSTRIEAMQQRNNTFTEAACLQHIFDDDPLFRDMHDYGFLTLAAYLVPVGILRCERLDAFNPLSRASGLYRNERFLRTCRKLASNPSNATLAKPFYAFLLQMESAESFCSNMGEVIRRASQIVLPGTELHLDPVSNIQTHRSTRRRPPAPKQKPKPPPPRQNEAKGTPERNNTDHTLPGSAHARAVAAGNIFAQVPTEEATQGVELAEKFAAATS